MTLLVLAAGLALSAAAYALSGGRLILLFLPLILGLPLVWRRKG